MYMKRHPVTKIGKKGHDVDVDMGNVSEDKKTKLRSSYSYFAQEKMALMLLLSLMVVMHAIVDYYY